MALSRLVQSVVVAILTLFIGIYMISAVSTVQGRDELKDYVYTDLPNTSLPIHFLDDNAGTFNFSIASVGSAISGETDDSFLVINLTNENDTSTIQAQVTINGTVWGNISVVNRTRTEIPYSFTAGYINVSVESRIGGNITVNETKAHYISSTTDTAFGEIWNTEVTQTATMYDVLNLVIVVVALGVAINVLKGMSDSQKNLAGLTTTV